MVLLQRSFPAAVVAAAVGGTALVNGGFFPTSWGWPTLAFLVLVVATLIVAERISLTRLDAIVLGAFAAFVAWTALSALWAPGAELPIQSAELVLLYLGGLAALLLLGSPTLPIGVLAAVVPVAAYALATRLVPDHVGTYNPALGGYLLAALVGYSNGLAMLCSLAVLVALGLVAHTRTTAVRTVAATSLVLLLPALYFTFSRGAAAALLLGIVVTLALDSRRLRYSVALLLALPFPLVGAWFGSRYGTLTHAGASQQAAAHDGHRVALALLVLALAQATLALATTRLERRIAITPRIRRAYLVALALAAAAIVAAGLVRIGDPVHFVSRATLAFKTDTPATGGNLNHRLVTLSGHGRADYWRVAGHEVRDHPLLGGGADTYRRYWLRYRPVPLGVLNAHNLYLETLAELGPVGLVLLLVALLTPLAAARGAPVAAGAYVAFLAHAAIDWDWQLPTVTLAGLAFAATLLTAKRSAAPRPIRNLHRLAVGAAAIPLAFFVFVAQLGNNALAASDRALAHDNQPAAVAHARTARRWLPWAASPWQRLGEAQLAQGDLAAASRSFHEALDRDRSDPSTWLDLALATTGRERTKALAEARRLDPLAPQIQALKP